MNDIEFLRVAIPRIRPENWRAVALFLEKRFDLDSEVEEPIRFDHKVVAYLSGWPPAPRRRPPRGSEGETAWAIRKTIDRIVATDPFFRNRNLSDGALETWLVSKGLAG